MVVLNCASVIPPNDFDGAGVSHALSVLSILSLTSLGLFLAIRRLPFCALKERAVGLGVGVLLRHVGSR